MRKALWIAVSFLVAPAMALAQSSGPKNPVKASAQEIFREQSKYLIEAAEQMPADKYSYHPTPQQRTFGQIIAHVVLADYGVCSMLAEMPTPQGPDPVETDPKEKLVPAFKASLDFCSQALAKLQDASLGVSVKFFDGRQVPRARALLELTDDLSDHYSQLASYLRLNGMLPPSAKK